MERVSGISVYLWIALVQMGCQFGWTNRLREVAMRLIAERWLAGRTFCRISIDSVQIFTITLSRQAFFYSVRRVLDGGLRWIAVTLLIGLAASNEAHAQSCNISSAQTQATGAYDHHRQSGNSQTAVAAYRALIAFGGNLPQWTGNVISSIAAPTTAISENELRTFLTGRSDSWEGWKPVYTALKCLEATLPAVAITGDSAVTEGSAARFTVNDDNDESAPISAELGSFVFSPLPEGAVLHFSIALSRALGSNETATLPLTIGGTATLGTDYRLACLSEEAQVFFTCSGLNGNSPSITFDGAILRGRRLVDGPLHLEALEDNTSESNETVTLSLGGGRTSTVQITDAPASVELSFFRATTSAYENDVLIEPVISVTPASGRDITVPLIFTDNTATGGADYTALAQVVLKANGSTRQPLDIPILDDTVMEGDETFKVAIDTANLPAGVTAGSITEMTLTIVDNDTTASFAASSSSAVESAGTHNVTVNLSRVAPSGGLTLFYNVTGTATAGSGNDFTIQGSGSLMITAGATSADIPVVINDDSIDDDNETVILTLTTGTGYSLGTTTVHTVTITDNDEPPPITAAGLVSLSRSNTLPEGARVSFNATFTSSSNFRLLSPTDTVTLPLTIGGTATLGTDYRLTCGVPTTAVVITCNNLDGNNPSITFDGSGLKSPAERVLSLYLEALEDNTSESNETVTLALGTGRTLTMRITDAPDSVTLSWTRDTYSVDEDEFVFSPVVRVTPASGRDITVPLIFTDNTATGGADYTPLAQVVLKADGATTYSFDIPILDDTVIEGDETFKVAIDTANLPAGAAAGSITESTFTIVDNDTMASFAAGSSSAAESAGTHNVTVNLSHAAPSGGLTLSYSVAGTATAGSGNDNDNDFTIQNSGTLSVSGGATTATIPVVINDDNVDDDNETVMLTLTDGTGYSLGTTTVHTLTITDNDESLTISAVLRNRGGSPLPEGGVINFNIAFSRALGNNETATLPLTIGGTATLGTDYRLACKSVESLVFFTCSGLNGNSPSITFDGAKLKGRKLFAGPLHLEALEDNTSESNETVTLALGGGRTSTVQITDAPASVALSFFRATYSVNEDGEFLHTVISVTPASARDITVPLIFTNITATGGADYTPLTQVVLKADGITRQPLDIPILDDTVIERNETFKVAIDTANLPTGVTAGSITEATLTIVDNDTTASFAASSSSAVESAGTHNVTVNLSRAAPSGGLTLYYSVAGTATAGSGNDFTIEGSGSLTIAAGATSADIPVVINDDSIDDDNETVILTLTDGTGYSLGTTTVHTVTITDNDEPPITGAGLVSLSRSNTLPEGARASLSATFTVTTSNRSLGPADTVTLPLTIGGTATLGTDYRLTCGVPTVPVDVTCNNLHGDNPSITFDGSRLKSPAVRVLSLYLEALEDNTSESNETVTLALGTGRTLTMRITDAPASVALSFTRDTYSVNENGMVLNPVVRVTPASGRDITVPLIFTDNTATSGADYTPLTQVVLEADGSTRYSFDVLILNDTVIEGDETFKMAIDTANLPAGATAGSITEATVTIVDNYPTASFAAGSSSAAESAGTHNVTVNLSHAPPSGGLTLYYSVAGTATAGSDNDFTIQGSGSLTIAAGETSSDIPVAINDDSIDDDNETVILTLTDGTGYNLGTTTVHKVTITDNDEPPITAAGLVSLSGSNTLPEGARASLNATFTASHSIRLLSPADTVTLPLTIGGTATLGTDYRLTCGVPPIPVDVTCNNLHGDNPSITFDGSRLQSPAERVLSLYLEALEDNTSESNETVTLALGTGRTLTMRITDAPDSVALSFTRDAYSVDEDGVIFSPIVRVTPASGRDITVPLIFTNITATDGTDYTPLAQVVLTANGRTTYSLDVSILDDTVIEGDETFKMAIDTANLPAGATAGSITEATVTIVDNDTTASFAAGSSSAAEDAGTHNVTVNLSQVAPSGGLMLSYSVAGTATAGSDNDFTIQGSGSLTIAAGATSADIPVAINDDSTAESTETVILTLTTGTGYTVGTTRVHTLTIVDNDSPPPTLPTASFGSASSNAAEDAGTRNVTVNLSSVAPSGGLTIGYSVAGTATSGSGNDFTIQGSGTLSVAAGANAATIPVVINDDSIQENAETVILTLTSGTGYTLGSTTVHTLTITDNDSPEISFDSAAGRIREGEVHTVVVNIDPATTLDLTLSYRLSGTATLEEDYRVQTPGMLQVPAGKSQALIRIEGVSDDKDEPRETLILTLVTGQGVSLGTPDTYELTLIDTREASLEAGWSWLVRFGRTVAQQVVDTISQRLRATRIEGTQVNVAGAQVPVGQSRAFSTFEPPTSNRPINDIDSHRQTSAQGSTRTMSEREVVQSSSFMSVGESDADGGSLAVWGQALHSSFEGREEDLSLEGDSTAVALGADYAQQAWQAGATLILSEGTGEYNDGVALGEVEASLTSIVPWAAVQATERVQLWGALGTGEGDLQLTDGSITTNTDIDWSMAAAGLRSVLVPASGENSLQLSLVGDALWVETKADPVAGLSIPDAQASRLRLGLEGQHSMKISSGAEVISRLEFGIREDSGDAETGGGIEIGGGVAWFDARSGLTIELAGRKLLSYDTDELEDEGISLSFDYDPVPNSAEGLSLSMHREIGVRSNGGLETLFGSEPLATRTDGEMENRVRLEAAYGVPVLSGQFIAGPQATMSRSATTRDYSIGWKVVSARRYEDISLQITALRSESHDRNPEHGISLGINARW